MLVFEETFICVRFWINGDHAVVEVHYPLAPYIIPRGYSSDSIFTAELKNLLADLVNTLPPAPGPLPIDLQNGDRFYELDDTDLFVFRGSLQEIAGKVRNLHNLV